MIILLILFNHPKFTVLIFLAISGNVWIYRIYDDFSKTPGTDDYCNPTLYAFAFWMTTATYIVMFVTCCCIICTGTVMGFAGKDS